jgi:hypothetical protein
LTQQAKSVGESDSPGVIIPPGESDVVRQLVKREVAQTLALQKAELDLQYRVERYREYASRYRTVMTEGADLKRRMDALKLPPQLLRTLKTE